MRKPSEARISGRGRARAQTPAPASRDEVLATDALPQMSSPEGRSDCWCGSERGAMAPTGAAIGKQVSGCKDARLNTERRCRPPPDRSHATRFRSSIMSVRAAAGSPASTSGIRSQASSRLCHQRPLGLRDDGLAGPCRNRVGISAPGTRRVAAMTRSPFRP